MQDNTIETATKESRYYLKPLLLVALSSVIVTMVTASIYKEIQQIRFELDHLPAMQQKEEKSLESLKQRQLFLQQKNRQNKTDLHLSDVTDFVGIISSTAKKTGITINRNHPSNTESDAMNIRLEFTCYYQDLGKFLDALEQYPTYIRVDNVAILKKNRQIAVNLNLTCFKSKGDK